LNIRFTKKRGLSEIIATLLLLVITIAGSAFLALIVQGGGFSASASNPMTSAYPAYSIKMMGYDTRDAANLLEISSIDNKFDEKLCTASCQSIADNIPAGVTPGTEFIVLQIKNVSPNFVYIKSIQVNGIMHLWDEQTGGKSFDASANDLSGKYPLNGKFSILPMSSLMQKSDNKLSEDEEIRLVIKLSKSISPDISLSKPIQVFINFGSTQATELVIVSGDTK
jgi:flagellin-like protein